MYKIFQNRTKKMILYAKNEEKNKILSLNN